MNIVDYIIIGIVGISVLFGLYRGFIATVLNTGGCLLSFGLSFWLYPKLAGLIQQNPQLQRTLLTYPDASSRIGDLETAVMKVGTLTQEKIADIVSRANLPEPLSELLSANLTGHIYTGIDSVSDYVSQTIVSACINILCFLVCFAAVYIIVSLLVSLLRAVFKLPVLKQLDALAGGGFGFLRGLLFVFAVFPRLPLVETMVPVTAVSELIAQSKLAGMFTGGGLVTAIMNGHL